MDQYRVSSYYLSLALLLCLCVLCGCGSGREAAAASTPDACCRAGSGTPEGVLREEVKKGDLTASVCTEEDTRRSVLPEPSGGGEEEPKPEGAAAPGEEENKL